MASTADKMLNMEYLFIKYVSERQTDRQSDRETETERQRQRQRHTEMDMIDLTGAIVHTQLTCISVGKNASVW